MKLSADDIAIRVAQDIAGQLCEFRYRHANASWKPHSRW